jgi:hypothetical protein
MAAERDMPNEDHDEVTEAGLESFPASDPPSYNMPARHRFVPKTPAAPSIETLGVPRPSQPDGMRRPTRAQSDADGSRRLTAWVTGVSAAILLLAIVATRR